ncbi:MAG: 50S ribosomal protein L17 [Desulfobacterales bacterium]
MRHRKSGIKLNRTTSHRNAMFRNMVTSLFKYDRIRTTDAKAKELRRLADNMVTLAKRGDLHARRQAMAVIREKSVVHRLFENANERFGNIHGGYTRVVKLGRRPGDAAMISIVELVSSEKEKKKKKKKTETAKAAPKREKKPEPAKEAAAPKEARPESVEEETFDGEVEETRSAEAEKQMESAEEEPDSAATLSQPSDPEVPEKQ